MPPERARPFLGIGDEHRLGAVDAGPGLRCSEPGPARVARGDKSQVFGTDELRQLLGCCDCRRTAIGPHHPRQRSRTGAACRGREKRHAARIPSTARRAILGLRRGRRLRRGGGRASGTASPTTPSRLAAREWPAGRPPGSGVPLAWVRARRSGRPPVLGRCRQVGRRAGCTRRGCARPAARRLGPRHRRAQPTARRGKYVSVDHRSERRGGVRHWAPSVEALRKAPGHGTGRSDQVVRGNVGEVGHAGGSAVFTADLRRDLGSQVGHEVRLRGALQDRATKGSSCCWHHQQGSDRTGPGRLPSTVTLPGSPPKRSMLSCTQRSTAS
jgi:hypothetical protein